jgi:hypothetical protein
MAKPAKADTAKRKNGGGMWLEYGAGRGGGKGLNHRFGALFRASRPGQKLAQNFFVILLTSNRARTYIRRIGRAARLMGAMACL